MSSRPLTIGIDARAASEVPAGRGRVVRELLRALASREDPHRYVLYARTRWDEQLDDRFRWALCAAGDPVWHARVGTIATRHCHVFLATNSYLSPLVTGVPSVLIIYDLAALDTATSPNRRSALVERLLLGPSVRRTAQLVCISEATRGALIARYPALAPRARVALLGARALVERSAPATVADLPEPGFVLAVGTLEPRKNLPRLVAGYAKLSPTLQAEHPLVVVGATGWRSGRTLDALQSLGSRCRMLGYVNDDDLAELYRRCAVFCYPSLNEGFGLPVLEAMAAGAPVITSDRSSLPEVGGAAAEYVDPLDVSDITRGMTAVLTDPARRAEMIAQGSARAAEFSWNDFARGVLDALVSSV